MGPITCSLSVDVDQHVQVLNYGVSFNIIVFFMLKKHAKVYTTKGFVRKTCLVNEVELKGI